GMGVREHVHGLVVAPHPPHRRPGRRIVTGASGRRGSVASMPWPRLRRGRTEDPALLLETAEAALDDGRSDEAYRGAVRAQRLLRRSGTGSEAEAGALLLQAAALSQLGRREPALAAATAATGLTADDAEAWRLR